MATRDRKGAAETEWRPPAFSPSAREKRLEDFFFDCAWTGKVHAGGQGPGSPEMEAEGGGTCRWLMGGMWLVGDFRQDQFSGGVYVLTWQLHIVVGWDSQASEYRAVLVDSNGTSAHLRGTIEGARLVMASVEPLTAGGKPIELRLTWDAADPRAVVWRNEMSVEGGPWFLVEDYVVEPLTL